MSHSVLTKLTSEILSKSVKTIKQLFRMVLAALGLSLGATEGVMDGGAEAVLEGKDVG
jgi:hypothetical protein